MSIATTSPFKSSPRISATKWMQVITPAFDTPLFNGIPREDRPAVAEGMYLRIVAKGHDPAVWLAIGVCEHSLGANPDSVLHRNDTRSLTNARTVRDPSLSGYTTITDRARGTKYVKYQTVVDSLQDGLYRVDEPGYAYRKANAVSIIDHTMIWTEGDGPQYAAKMVKLINEWMEEDTSMALTPPAGWTPPEIVRRILPSNASNTPQRTMDWQWITVHNTGNPNPSANALMHANWLESLARSGASEPSWQYTVDDTRVVQHLRDDQAGWHASDDDGPGNFASLGFELVEIGDQERVLWNAGYVMAQRLKSKSKDVDAMRQHHDWARDKKNCPRLLRANDGAGWKRLLAIVAYFLDDAPPPPPPSDTRILVDGNPFGKFGYALGFKGRLQQIGAAVSPSDPIAGILAWAGWPREDEWRGADGCTYQRTERLILKYEPGVAPPFDIVARLRNAPALPERIK